MNDQLEEIGFYTLSNDRADNVSDTSQMQRCEMIITEYCNFKCPYCRGLDAEIYGDRRVKQLGFEEIQQNIDHWCEDQPLKNIRFSGGEPTLHRDIDIVVAYAKAKGIERIAISTNGSSDIDLYKKLIALGCNDFSISLDACCAEVGDKMSGDIKGSWDMVIDNIREISKLTYVTVGLVFTPDNIDQLIETIELAHELGVADIRIISAAQWDRPLPELDRIRPDILEAHPILKYRVQHFIEGRNVRGIKSDDSNRCALVVDDSVIAGDYHFPCIIYMREQGKPIGKIGPTMRADRIKWMTEHDTYDDSICRKNCLDVCIDYNNRACKSAFVTSILPKT